MHSSLPRRCLKIGDSCKSLVDLSAATDLSFIKSRNESWHADKEISFLLFYSATDLLKGEAINTKVLGLDLSEIPDR